MRLSLAMMLFGKLSFTIGTTKGGLQMSREGILQSSHFEYVYVYRTLVVELRLKLWCSLLIEVGE